MKTQVVVGLFCLIFAGLASGQTQSHLPKGLCPLVIDYTYYSLCYDSEHRQAAWVKHKLTLASIKGKQKRTNDYREDPLLEDPVLRTDYKGSGYDRGHLLPAADMKLNHTAMSETFFMTNMSPQVPSFNRYIWVAIENRVRHLVGLHGEAHVVTGPILRPGLGALQSGVSVPQWYYKVAFFPGPQIMKAFLIENKKHKGAHYSDFLVTVDEVEALSGFDFFADLPDLLESEIESKIFRE